MVKDITDIQKEQLVRELDILDEKLKNTINKKLRSDIILDISKYTEILGEIYDNYEKLEYFIELEISNRNYDNLEKMYIEGLKNEINHLHINNYFYDILSNNILNFFKGKSFNCKINENNLNSVDIDIFISLVNNNFPKKFSSFLEHEIYDNRLLLTNNMLGIGACYDIVSLNKSISYYFCEVKNEKNLTYYDLMTVIHEITHGYLHRKFGINDNLFDEVYSIFNELKLNNIIFNQKNVKEDNQLYDFEFLDSINDAAIDLNTNLKILKKLDYSTKFIQKETFVKKYSDCVHVYILAYILALELFYQDLKDSELAHYNISKLYNSKGNLEDINKLEGISIDSVKSCDSVKKYVKDVNNRWSLKK